MNDNGENFVFLLQVYNDVEADIVEGLLSQYNIKTVKRYRGNKSFIKTIMGTVLGVDIFVKSRDLKEAKDIIADMDMGDSNNDL
ncbi:MAG: hypothetical protein GX154_00370 [Clostridiales bacterium]|nr:hypothetical protein [Clostridiales bacterium]